MIRLGQVQIRKALGQTAEEWRLRAEKAILTFADLSVKADALSRQTGAWDEIAAWVGSEYVPGTPSERAAAVGLDLKKAKAEGASAVYDSETATQRVIQLEELVPQFEAKINIAQQTYGSLPAPEGAGGQAEVSTTTLCITGGIALLGLVVLPILLE